MSSTDVRKSAEIIKLVLEHDPGEELSNTTIDNLISTVDNLQTYANITELRKRRTSEKLRESAVGIVGEIVQGKSSNSTFKPMNSVG